MHIAAGGKGCSPRDVDSNAAAALSSLNSDALRRAQALLPSQTPNYSEALAPAAMGQAALMRGFSAQQHGYGAPLAGDPLGACNQQLLGKRSRDTGTAVKQGWTRYEDATILQIVREVGNKWSHIAAQLPGRSDDAVRNRYIRIKVTPLDTPLAPPGALTQPRPPNLVPAPPPAPAPAQPTLTPPPPHPSPNPSPYPAPLTPHSQPPPTTVV